MLKAYLTKFPTKCPFNSKASRSAVIATLHTNDTNWKRTSLQTKGERGCLKDSPDSSILLKRDAKSLGKQNTIHPTAGNDTFHRCVNG